MKKQLTSVLIALVVLLALAQVPSASASGVVSASIVWYRLYLNQNSTYTQLYNQSLECGVDNETLKLAEELYANATEEFNKALDYGNPQNPRSILWVPFMRHIRKAYINIIKANELLKESLEKRKCSP
ncbi:MAG: hypothetical protein PWQ79_1900 [Thermococcaceae archaeon]|nr:hypothetical protein [Thermococcaceae archaeon]